MTDKTEINQTWDLILRSKESLFSLKLRAVIEYKDLLFLLVRRDFVSFYKQTILGPLWFFVQPLITTLIYIVIFGNVIGVKTEGVPQALFFMTGIICWNYFSECLQKTSTTFKDNAHIFGKVYFPRLIMPLSIIFSNLIRFAVQFVLLILAIVFYVVFYNYNFQFFSGLIFLPLLILHMAILGLAIGLIISSITIKYRDLTYLVTFGVQLLMYATPIIYPLSGAPSKIKTFIAYNPLTPIVEGIRLSILGRGDVNTFAMISSVCITFILLIVGVLIFNKVEQRFADTI